MTSDEEKIFIEAFNQGYLLEKHDPELLHLLLKSEKARGIYFEGLRDERDTRVSERVEAILKLKNKRKQRDQDHER